MRPGTLFTVRRIIFIHAVDRLPRAREVQLSNRSYPLSLYGQGLPGTDRDFSMTTPGCLGLGKQTKHIVSDSRLNFRRNHHQKFIVNCRAFLPSYVDVRVVGTWSVMVLHRPDGNRRTLEGRAAVAVKCLTFHGSLLVGEEVIPSDLHEAINVGCVTHTVLVAIGNLIQNR